MINVPVPVQTLIGQMQALSDPTRLRLLRLLERQELGVTDLCDVLQMPQSSVSRHLKLLAEQGWVHNRRQGTNNFYRMTTDDLDQPTRRLWQLARDRATAWTTCNQDLLRLQRRLRQRKAAAQKFFAGAAAQWDKLRGELYGQGFSTAAMLALLSRDLIVADLGCGTGHTAAALAPCVAKVIGVDQSQAMLRAAHQRTAGQRNVELRRGDLEALPIDSESCDAALMLLVLTYVSDPPTALGEMARVLRPGGQAVIVDLLPHDRDDFRRQIGQQCLGFAPRKLEALLVDAGMKEVKTTALPPEPDAKGPALQLATAIRN